MYHVILGPKTLQLHDLRPKCSRTTNVAETENKNKKCGLSLASLGTFLHAHLSLKHFTEAWETGNST